MRVHKIEFKGDWLGGTAIVIADTQYEAWKLISDKHPTLESFDECQIEDISLENPVLYFDTGDY